MKVKKNFEIFNVGTGIPISVNKIVNLLGCESVKIPKRPGEPDQTNAKINKIQNELNWSPKISIELGIKKLLKDINYWNNAPVWTPKLIKGATKEWFKYLK
jgi:UDP-glucose 4-epimerase